MRPAERSKARRTSRVSQSLSIRDPIHALADVSQFLPVLSMHLQPIVTHLRKRSRQFLTRHSLLFQVINPLDLPLSDPREQSHNRSDEKEKDSFGVFEKFAHPIAAASMELIMVTSRSNFCPINVRNSFMAALVSAIRHVRIV